MSEQPNDPIPDDIEFDPGNFENPARVYIRFSQPLPRYEDFVLASPNVEEPAFKECEGTKIRRLFDSIDPESAPTDYLTMYYFDPQVGQEYFGMDKCMQSLGIPHPEFIRQGDPRTINNAEPDTRRLIIEHFLSPLGAPHKPYLGKKVQLAIADTLWDIPELIQKEYRISLKTENAALEKCKQVLEPMRLKEFKDHAVNAYRVIFSNLAAISPEANPPILITVADDDCNLRWSKSIRGMAIRGMAIGDIANRDNWDRLNAGDVLLLEGQSMIEGGTIKAPLELHPDDDVFEAIQDVVRKGIVVIEPMGNDGKVDLDKHMPAVVHHSFNPDEQFRHSPHDSGAILVAAYKKDKEGNVVAYPGTNIGVRADLHAPGESIYASNSELPFGWTSGAAAIVAGIAVAAQSAVIASGRPPLNSLEMRHYLKASGSSPVNGIGVMPNLQNFIEKVLDTIPR